MKQTLMECECTYISRAQPYICSSSSIVCCLYVAYCVDLGSYYLTTGVLS
jgi:hypothetical protein